MTTLEGRPLINSCCVPLIMDLNKKVTFRKALELRRLN